MELNFLGSNCKIEFRRYSNGNTAIELIDIEDLEPFTVATINTGNVLDKELVAIKNYSENEGMVDALQKAGIISELVSTIDAGFVTIPIYKLSEEALSYLK